MRSEKTEELLKRYIDEIIEGEADIKEIYNIANKLTDEILSMFSTKYTVERPIVALALKKAASYIEYDRDTKEMEELIEQEYDTQIRMRMVSLGVKKQYEKEKRENERKQKI